MTDIEIYNKIISGELSVDANGNVYDNDTWKKLKETEKLVEYYDLLQLTKKIQMNSLYGSLLASSFRFGDKRMGASVTGSGRIITEHMIYDIEKNATGIPKKFAKVRGKVKKGKKGVADHDTYHYIIQRSQLETLRKAKKLLNPKQQLPESFIDFEACIYSDTDSVVGETLVYVNNIQKQIKELYEEFEEFEYKDEFNKSYVKPISNITTLSFNGTEIDEKPIKYIMKHRVKKEMFKITVDNKSVIVTEDHSIIVIRKNKMISVKPYNLESGDKVINIC